MSVLGFLTLTACSKDKPSETKVVSVTKDKPKLIVQKVTPINTRKVSWLVITKNNIEEIFNSLPEGTALFAVTAEGYEALSLNLSDVRAMLEQQQSIILAYKNYYED